MCSLYVFTLSVCNHHKSVVFILCIPSRKITTESCKLYLDIERRYERPERPAIDITIFSKQSPLHLAGWLLPCLSPSLTFHLQIFRSQLVWFIQVWTCRRICSRLRLIWTNQTAEGGHKTTTGPAVPSVIYGLSRAHVSCYFV